MGRGRGRRVCEEAPVAALPRCSPLTVETVRSRWFASGLRGVVLTDRMTGRDLGHDLFKFWMKLAEWSASHSVLA